MPAIPVVHYFHPWADPAHYKCGIDLQTDCTTGDTQAVTCDACREALDLPPLWPNHQFDPDWCLHPGVTFNECLDERGITTWIVAETDYDEINALRDLKPVEITYRLADVIVEVLGEPETVASFWVNLSNNYQAGLRAGKKDVTPR